MAKQQPPEPHFEIVTDQTAPRGNVIPPLLNLLYSLARKELAELPRLASPCPSPLVRGYNALLIRYDRLEAQVARVVTLSRSGRPIDDDADLYPLFYAIIDYLAIRNTLLHLLDQGFELAKEPGNEPGLVELEPLTWELANCVVVMTEEEAARLSDPPQELLPQEMLEEAAKISLDVEKASALLEQMVSSERDTIHKLAGRLSELLQGGDGREAPAGEGSPAGPGVTLAADRPG